MQTPVNNGPVQSNGQMASPQPPFNRPHVNFTALENLYKTRPKHKQMLYDILKLAAEKGIRQYYTAVPVFQNQPLDIVRLYELVIERGGISKVLMEKSWMEIILPQNLNLPGVTAVEFQYYYKKYLLLYEQQQLLHRNARTVTAKPTLPTVSEVQTSQSFRMMDVPLGTRRIKIHVQKVADLTALHKFVLALDSDINDQVMWALNQLTILSYGSDRQDDEDIQIAEVPALIDALSRQLEPVDKPAAEVFRTRDELLQASEIFNLAPMSGQKHITEGKTLLVLNILRNLSFTMKNRRPLGTHDVLPRQLIQLIDSGNSEIVNHALDILCCIAKHIGMPQDDAGDLHGQDDANLVVEYSPQMKSIIEKLVDRSIKFLLRDSRSDVLRSCELLMQLSQNASNEMIFEAASPKLYHRLTELLSMNVEGIDSLCSESSSIKAEENWPAPWIDSNAAGSEMGVVFGPRGSIQSSWPRDSNLDHEIRDAALDVLYYLSDYGLRVKLRIGKEPYCLSRIGNVLTSRIGRAEAARIAAGTLSNISMNRATFRYFLKIERELVLVASADENVTGLLSNVIADVYGMQSLRKF